MEPLSQEFHTEGLILPTPRGPPWAVSLSTYPFLGVRILGPDNRNWEFPLGGSLNLLGS